MHVESHLPLTPREFHVLLALAGEPRNGYQIGQQAEENSRGSVRLSPATQYTNLHRLVKRGLVEEVTEPADDRPAARRQRYWTLTPLGTAVLRAEGRRLAADAALVEALGPEGRA